MATEILNGALSKIGEYLMEANVHQIGYLFRFKRNIEGLMSEDKNLRLALDRVQQEVDSAKRNAEDIEKDVQKWLDDVSDVITAVQKLEGEIQANKACLSGLCPNLAWRYWLSGEAEKMTSKLLKLVNSGKFDRVAHRAILPGIEFFSSKDFVQFESTRSTLDQIIEAMKDDKINMVGIYGMGGVGKTTMAKEVAKKVKELGIFKEVVFATVSQNPNVRKIQAEIADSLGLKLQEESEDGRARRLWMRLRDEKKILIILDDVWAKLDLTIIGVPFTDGCKILLTTRRKQVCHSMGCESKIPVNALVEEEGLALFKRNACIGDELPTINDLAKEVARECRGLPLAIVTIGSALKGKPIDEWNVVLKKLKNSKFVDVEDVDADIYALLRLSYDYLKDEETKLCFLLCSLYPEDYQIPLEELVRYGKGLGLYEDANTIEEARSQLRVMIYHLKASCLLLDDRNEELVKMHDIVRDVAVCIASKEKKFFCRAGLGMEQWPKDERLEQYAAISLMANKLEVLPVSLAYPKLEILLLDCKYRAVVEVSDQFLVETKALKVVYLSSGDMSVKSLQFLTNLRSLCLHDCKLKDISSIGTLSRLEILSFRNSRFVELAKELGELAKLSQLDLRGCRWLERIPANVIRRLSQLEELYIGDKSFSDWDVEGTGAETSNASLYELNSLSRLTILLLWIEEKHIPKDFIFPQLLRYQITVKPLYSFSYLGSFPLHFSEKGSLGSIEIKDFGSTSLNAFKEICHTLQTLDVSYCEALICLFSVSLAQSLVQLETLRVSECWQMKHIFADGSDIMLPKLRELRLIRIPNFLGLYPRNYCSPGKVKESPGLTNTWRGSTQQLSLHNLTEVIVRECHPLTYLFTVSLARSLVQLEKLRVIGCGSMKHLLVTEEEQLMDNNILVRDGSDILLPKLRELALHELEKFVSLYSRNYCSPGKVKESLGLRNTWRGSTQQLSLHNLTEVTVHGCNALICLFTVSLARSLVQLENLHVLDCSSMEHILVAEEEQLEDNNILVGDGSNIVLPKLKELKLWGLKEFVSFCVGNYYLTWPSLQKLTVHKCRNTSPSFTFFEARGKDSNFLKVNNIARLRHGLKNLKFLEISNCLAQVVFQVEGFEFDGGEGEHFLSFPSLATLDLTDLPELECIWKGPSHFLNLQNLSTLNVYTCPRLRRIFSTTLARHLSKLKFLSISGCSALEQIIVQYDEEEEQHQQPACFSNLSKISVDRCKNLKSLFHVNIARNLQQLKVLDIYNCEKLEQIFVGDDAVKECKEIVLPGLEQLKLQRVPGLVQLCPVGTHLIFPSLTRSIVTIRPKIAARFSVDQNGSLHVKSEEGQLGDEITFVKGIDTSDHARMIGLRKFQPLMSNE